MSVEPFEGRTVFDPHKDRTQLRLRLYQNGFTPLANNRKMCLVKGWSSMDVTPEIIQSKEWARSGRDKDTGIRCGEVIALDWDIDDKALLNDLLDAVVEQNIVAESRFVRIGKAPRELWVYRTQDKIGKRTTGHFGPENRPDDFKGYAVEVLGNGCQFAAYGQRDETTAYSWPEQDLLDHEYMDLPEITLAQVERLKDFCAEFLQARGLIRLSPGGGTDKGYTHVYDLVDDMEFEVQDIGVMSVADMAEYFAANPEGVLRCKVEVLRPTGGSWAGMASLVGGAVCISDHGTYTSHFPVAADMEAKVSRLGALLAERFPTPPPELVPPIDLGMDPAKSFDDNLALALRRYVYVDNDAVVVDIWDNFTTHTMKGLRDSLGPFYTTKTGARGGEVITELAELWRRDAKRIKVTTTQMRPDQSRPFFEENGSRHLNVYKPVEHPAINGDASIGFDMIAGLLPVESERKYFLQWLSYKVANPGTPGPAIMMVAHDSYGTGRGSLITMLTKIFSNNYVARISFDTLSGKGTQSQYNDWLAGNLIVAVDEAQDTNGGSRWQARNNAYEHLKNIVDPAPREIEIKRKGLKNGKAWTFASILVATNHADAMVIPDGDRRFAVLENGAPRPQEYWDKFHTWLKGEGNIGAFVRELRGIDLTGYNPMAAPPMTRAKADMIDAGASELDRAVKQVLTGLQGGLIVKEQLILKLEDYLVENAAEFPDDWQRIVDALFKRSTRKLLGEDRVTIGNRRYTVRMVKPVDITVLSSPEEMIKEVGLNGPLARQIQVSGRVVQFPSR